MTIVTKVAAKEKERSTHLHHGKTKGEDEPTCIWEVRAAARGF